MSASTRQGFAVLVVGDPDRPAVTGRTRMPGHDPDRIRCAADVYQALAMLVVGPRPAVLAVQVDDLDWEEFDFFDQVRRIAPEIRVLATSAAGDQPRLEQARRRGAELAAGFDLEAWTSLAPDVPRVQAPPVERSRAGPATAAAVPGAPVAAPDSSDQAGCEEDAIPFTALLGSKPSLKTARELVAGSVQPVLTPVEPPASASSAPPAAAGSTVPNVRLVQPEEPDAPPAIPFPWAPSPTRPKRTPPGAPPARSHEAPQAERARSEPGDAPRPAPDPAGRAPINVELTREEIAALLRGPRPGQEGLREGQA